MDDRPEDHPAGAACAYHEISRSSDVLVFVARAVHYARTRGVRAAFRRFGERIGLLERLPPVPAAARDDEVLALQPGERVRVKDADEIRETLDERGTFRRLHFMEEMWNYCGQTFTVMKRLDRLMVERTGQMRTIKDTVLLDGTMCDGSRHKGCDASCQHLWREVWLRRADED